MTGIIDIGIGNVGSLLNMLKRISCDCKIVSSANDFVGVKRLIFPGVGSFDHGMEQLDQSGLRSEMERLVLEMGMPFLGICLGMQLLGKTSEEGVKTGLEWLDAESIRFRPDESSQNNIKVPHMGWNHVKFTDVMSDFKNTQELPRFYFVHSFHVIPRDPSHMGGVTEHGIAFTSIVRKENIIGCQFHPEKSHRYGMEFLSDFTSIS